MGRFCSAWLAALLCVVSYSFADLPAAEPVTTPAIRERGLVSPGDTARLAAVMAKARRGEEICVAAIGGSITAGGLQTKDPKTATSRASRLGSPRPSPKPRYGSSTPASAGRIPSTAPCASGATSSASNRTWSSWSMR
jgi:hypothetical protein